VIVVEGKLSMTLTRTSRKDTPEGIAVTGDALFLEAKVVASPTTAMCEELPLDTGLELLAGEPELPVEREPEEPGASGSWQPPAATIKIKIKAIAQERRCRRLWTRERKPSSRRKKLRPV
jgi:hypothetical protein